MLEKKFYKKNSDFLEKINSKQSSWTATHYDFMTKMTIKSLIRMAGGKNSRMAKYA